MRRRTVLAGLGTAAAGGSALLASGSFSRVESNRAVTIERVGDEDAYIRLVYTDRSVDCTDTVELVEITNQLKDDLVELEVELQNVEDSILGDLSVPGPLAVGESGSVTLTVECDPGEETTTTVLFDVYAQSTSSYVEAESREIDISCSCSSENPETFDGTAISFAAFCSGDTPATVTDITVTHVKPDEADEPTGISWTSDDPISEVVLYGGREWYRFEAAGATSGTALMDETAADEAVIVDPPGNPFPISFADDWGDRRPNIPCGCAASTKVDVVDGEFDIDSPETTDDEC